MSSSINKCFMHFYVWGANGLAGVFARLPFVFPPACPEEILVAVSVADFFICPKKKQQ